MFQLAWRRPRPAPRPGTHLTVTPFEERCVPAAGGTAGAPVGPVHTVVYTESNDPRPGENAVLAFRRTPTGGLARIGRFETGGTGQLNIPKVIGPDDGDQQVMATPDGRFLFAVNQGSDSVTAFRIRPDGTLARIGVFASGGDQPVSIGIAGTRLYVANRGNAAQGQPATTVSDITAFDIGPDGTLTPVAGSTITYPLGTFATQALVAPGGMLVFVNLGSLEGTADGNTVAPYQVLPDGRLALAPGGPVGASAAPTFQLGLAAHPTEPIVYAGLTADGRVAVYTYDSAGQTTGRCTSRTRPTTRSASTRWPTRCARRRYRSSTCAARGSRTATRRPTPTCSKSGWTRRAGGCTRSPSPPSRRSRRGTSSTLCRSGRTGCCRSRATRSSSASRTCRQSPTRRGWRRSGAGLTWRCRPRPADSRVAAWWPRRRR
jgi:hypothetical protein